MIKQMQDAGDLGSQQRADRLELLRLCGNMQFSILVLLYWKVMLEDLWDVLKRCSEQLVVDVWV